MQERDFWGHLDELRTCILKSLAGLLVGVVISFAFVSHILKFLSQPYVGHLANLKSLSPGDTFSVTVKTAILTGLGLSFPWIAYQLWGFISPGLHKHERKYVVPFCASVAFFFLAGSAFAYFLVLPAVVSFFYEYSIKMGVAPDWTISNYLEFVTTFLVSFGVVFELPVAIATLTFFGVTNSKWLASYRRHAIVVIFIVAAIFTPPDFISQITMAVPMVILYEVSILVSKMIEKKNNIL